MKIWSKRELSTKRAEETRVFLLAELRSYTWKREPTPEENAQAAETLRRILAYLRETPPGPRTMSTPEWGRRQMDYLLPLMVTEEKLRQGDYWNACHELMDLVYFYLVLRPGVRQNMIGLLEEYVEA